LVAIGLVVLCAIPLICATLLILFGGQMEREELRRVAADPTWHPPAWILEGLSRVGRYAVAVATTIVVAGCLLYFAPYRRQRWRYVWPGSLLATALWLAATSSFGWYVRHMGSYNVMYGSIGAGIAMLVWMYLLAIIALIACEFNAAYERIHRH
jgi:membrane protein